MKRIGLYLFYDADGVIDDYVVYKLKEISQFIDEIVFISNCPIDDCNRKKVSACASSILVRENIGFDVWAYKEAIEKLGVDYLCNFDELVLFNYTFFAPIFPFDEMFTWSEKENVDFWGISDHAEVKPNPFTGTGILHRHIQSHFISIRKSLFLSKDFIEYWQKMPMIKSYQESILHHESKFTQFFYERGFKFSSYIDSSDYPSDYPTFNDICLTLKNRSPILKRRPFFHDPLWIDKNAIDLRHALEIIDETSNYNVDLIYKNLLRTTKPKDLATNIDLLKIFDSDGDVEVNFNESIAVLAHVFYPDMMPELMEYINNIPSPYDLYISVANDSGADVINDFLSNKKDSFNLRSFEIRVVAENRGRDIGSLLITMQDVVLDKNYDYICRVHSKKSPQNSMTQSEHFKKQMFDNLLLNKVFVSKLLKFLRRNPNVGFLAPSMVHIGYPTLGHSWFTNKQLALDVANKLGIIVPFDDFSPFAAYGTMFWFRPKALRRIFNNSWKWNDFNAEPWHSDGSLSHVIERLFIYAAHTDGYVGYNVMSSEMAEKNYSKLEYKAQRIMSCLHNGDVQEQVNNLRGGSFGVKNSLRSLFYSIAKSIMFRYPAVGGIMKKIYIFILGRK